MLKGAQMLRVWGISHARSTMDIDLLRRREADQASLIKLVEEWVATEIPDDGVVFFPSSITAESIRDETEYVGTRIRLDARLDKVRQKSPDRYWSGRRRAPRANNHPVPGAPGLRADSAKRLSSRSVDR